MHIVLSPLGVTKTKQSEDAFPSSFSLFNRSIFSFSILLLKRLPYLSFFLLPIKAHFPPSLEIVDKVLATEPPA